MIAAIENAVLAALKQAGDTGRLGYRFLFTDSYPEDWDVYLKDKVGVIKAPAAWVTFGGWARSDSNRPGARRAATFGLVVMAENLRNETATRHGDPVNAARPGSYQLAEDAAGLLQGNTLGLDIEPILAGQLRFVPRFPAFRDKPVSMLSIELVTGFAVPALPSVEGFTDYDLAHVNWDVPVHLAGPALPDDADADLTDSIPIPVEP